MTEIKIALTNLGKYNEGVLAFEWLELPYTDDELNEAKQAIGISDQYEEYFISDYEAPFSIDEYESLTKLNDIATALEECDFEDANKDVDALINFAQEAEYNGYISDSFEYVGDIVDDEELDDMVEQIAKDGGWQRVRHFLAGIDFMNEGYYMLNGYANAVSIPYGTVSSIFEDIVDEIERNL